MWVIIVLGIIAFLLMEHPIAFWLIFVPLGLLLMLSVIMFFVGKKASILSLLSWYLIFGIILIAIIMALVLVV